MLEKIRIENMWFLDIETVPAYATFDQVPEKFQKLWEKKARFLGPKDEEQTAEELYERAGIYA